MKRSSFSNSPAMRKLLGKRGNLVAMGVIGVYVLTFAWILLMEIANWAGDTTGLYDLEEASPIMAALLPDRVQDRVGANNELGFGIAAAPTERMEHYNFYLRNIGTKLFEEIDQGKAEGVDTRPIEEIRASAALAERGLADLPVEELRVIYERGLEVKSRQGELRSLRDSLPRIELAIDKLRGFRAQFEGAEPGTEAWEIAAEDVALTLDELLVLLERYAPDAPEGDPVAAMDLEPMRVAMDAAFDYEPLDPIYDAAWIGALQSAIADAGPVIDKASTDALNELSDIVYELYPIPDGVKGIIYRIRAMLGTDEQGRSIFVRAVYSAKVAIQVGVVVSVIAVLFGSIIGAAAGYFGGITDHAVIWLYSTFSSIPYLVLLVVLAFMFTGSVFEGTLIPLYAAFSLTFWIGPCRVIRGEALKLRSLDYVQAAQALGASRWRILSRHILPNTSHLIFINMSLLFIGAIKGEVVLTFLGLGLKEGASWGIMINQSQPEVVAGFFWQIGAATFFMFVLVLAFNVFTDALQDAFDPKHTG